MSWTILTCELLNSESRLTRKNIDIKKMKMIVNLFSHDDDPKNSRRLNKLKIYEDSKMKIITNKYIESIIVWKKRDIFHKNEYIYCEELHTWRLK